MSIEWESLGRIDGADYECDLGVVKLVIFAADGPCGRADSVQWDCHWNGDGHTGHSASIEEAKRDSKAFGLALLQQVADQLKRLEP